ncbi:MAG: GNAT family N-acetyltransferase [Armatimonadetes bacterium]|nr:GNAT family N-acetyltransferase [Armatimonadota bacterium]
MIDEHERKLLNVEDVFGDLPSLETPRLVLRRLTRDDAEDIFAYGSDPEVTRYTGWQTHRTIEDSRVFLNGVLALYESKQVAPWGIAHKTDRKLIGTCGFVYWLPQHARAEIGYGIARPYWRQGYTTEAIRAIIAFGFQSMQLNRIEARCEPENTGSWRVMEKVGMTFEGVLRQHNYAKGTYRDTKMYSILRQEWTG